MRKRQRQRRDEIEKEISTEIADDEERKRFEEEVEKGEVQESGRYPTGSNQGFSDEKLRKIHRKIKGRY